MKDKHRVVINLADTNYQKVLSIIKNGLDEKVFDNLTKNELEEEIEKFIVSAIKSYCFLMR